MKCGWEEAMVETYQCECYQANVDCNHGIHVTWRGIRKPQEESHFYLQQLRILI